MKRIFKFIPAALAVVALSSCSNDDLFGSREGNLSQKNTLKVTVQQINDGDITRAANFGDGNGMVWQDDDQITVYDDQLFIYDPYKYNATAKAFVLDEDEMELIDEPAYALFPTAYFAEDESTNWERATDRVWVKANIPAQMKYGAPSDDATADGDPYVTANGKTAYVSLLPMWGTASKNGETTEATMQYMTAIIKVQLTNAMGNVNYLYVRGFKDIAGTQYAQLNGDFKAYLSETGRTPLASTTLASNEDADETKNYIEVDISNINKATSIIYIPVPVGHYGKLQVWATKTQVANPGLKTTLIDPADKIYDFVDKDFEVKFYGSLTKKVYDVDGSNVEKLNDLLEANKDEVKDELVLNCAGTSATATAVNPAGETVTLPNMAAGSVELKLKGITGGALKFEGSEFSKKFILNLATTDQPITIDLPNADIVLAGDFNNKDVTILNAKSLTFGDGTAPTEGTDPTTKVEGTIDVKAEVQGNIVVEQFAKVSALALPDNHRATGITVNEKGEAGVITVNASELATATGINVAGKAGAITTPNDASTITVSGSASKLSVSGTGAVTISGKLVGTPNIEMTNDNPGTLTISGAPVYDGTYAKAGSVFTKGDVMINLSNEGAAISGNLTMKEGKTLTLTQGYVKNIVTMATTSTTSPKVTVALGTDDNYKNVLIDAGATGRANVTVTGTTKWNGEEIGGSVDEDAEWKAAGLEEKPTAAINSWKDYKDAATAVYTATGLAMNKGAFTLKNNIDLNNQPWTPTATIEAIDGGGKTISHLKVAVPKDGDAAGTDATNLSNTNGLGLFTSVGHNVSNLKLSGVTIEAAEYKAADSKKYKVVNVGALAGKATTTVTLTKITVENALISSTGGAYNIGGIVGSVNSACAPLTLSGVKVSGSTIKGYKSMGGLVGYASGNVTVATEGTGSSAVVSSVSTTSFVANYNSAKTDPAIDVDYLRVGNFIGSASKDKEIVITCAAADVKAALNSDTSIFPGYKKFNEGINFYDYIFGQTLIGFCGNTTFTTAPRINEKSYQLSNSKPNPVPSEYLYYINK